MGTDSRHKMLETARNLFRTQGYNGTGLNQILKESGAPKGSLYHHFPGGKEQLAIEAMEAAAKEMAGKIFAAFDASSDLMTAMNLIVDNASKELEESNFECGCPIATVALEATPGPVLEVCTAAFLGAQKILESRMLLEGFSPEKAQTLATLMFSAYEGAVILSRTQRDATPLRRLKKALPLLLSRP